MTATALILNDKTLLYLLVTFSEALAVLGKFYIAAGCSHGIHEVHPTLMHSLRRMLYH